MNSPSPTIPFTLPHYSVTEAQNRALSFYDYLQSRRTVRNFAETPIPETLIDQAILAAGTAPNGANLQPWHFAIVQSPKVKSQIREAAEQEEREFYQSRAPQSWLDDLSPLGTNAEKPFLEKAPALIVIFQKNKTARANGQVDKTYYPKESVGIATGILITALHNVGLATLTHTPSPMSFLNDILERPSTEKPFLLLVVGYPAPGCEVPAISKKTLSEISSKH